MNHTLESLLVLAETDDGRQRIQAIVAELVGYIFRDETFAERKGVYTSTGGFIGLDKPNWHPYPDYHASLDAIMPEVRRLDEKAAEKWANFMADIFYQKGNLGWKVCYAIATAQPVHHCIAFILTKQKP